MNPKLQFIVAEVTKNWHPDQTDAEPICVKFERIIELNLERGYELHSFDLNQVMTNEKTLTETIIAVFHSFK